MKKLMMKDLGGPPNDEFEISGETFEEIAANCQAHVKERLEAGDQAYMDAVERMKSATPEEQQAMFAEYKKNWDEAPEVEG